MTGDPSRSDAVEYSAMLRDVVDAMLPGSGRWPAASTVGVHGVVAMRLLEVLGESSLATVSAAIDGCGGPLSRCDESGRQSVLQKLEATQPKLFALLRSASYLAYYESPAVILQVQKLGQPYAAVPIKHGYDVGQFDIERDSPKHNRGRYIATADVKRVDTSKLTHLRGGHAKTTR